MLGLHVPPSGALPQLLFVQTLGGAHSALPLVQVAKQSEWSALQMYGAHDRVGAA
jgi:hypothetical protein